MADFDLLWLKFGPQKIFLCILPQLDVIHSCKLSLYAIQKNLMNQTSENGKKNPPSFGSKFDAFGPNWGHQTFFQKSGFVSH